VLLLKGLAAVAEVARPEDVGIDAVANLLRPNSDDRCLYAEDGFIVQLKSESTTSVEYQREGIEWFLNETLPMFVGRVSLKKAKISLYANTLRKPRCARATAQPACNEVRQGAA
jgi:hypothetical protein